MTYVSLGICFWAAIAANLLTIWEDDNTEGGRCNTILQALAPINIYCCCCEVASVVSDPVRPHRGQPTRLRCPWDSPGKNTEWVAISFSNAWKWNGKVKSLSRVGLLATPWTAAYQTPPSMGFSRQEYWSVIFTEQLLSVRLCWVFLSLFFFLLIMEILWKKTLSLILLTSKRTWEKYLLMTSQQVRGGATCYPGQSTFLVKMN